MPGLMIRKKFDPEGSDYDYEGAAEAGMKRIGGHMGSIGKGGMVLKGRKHKTWNKTVKAEKARRHKIVKKKGRYWTVPEYEESPY
jgi:hypothetical protein